MSFSILHDEIFEQPDIIHDLLKSETHQVANIAKEIRGQFKYVLIAARGTSDNAARYAQYLFGSFNRYQVSLATPSLFTLYNTPPDLSEALVIGISQSGQSPDIVSVLSEAKNQGRPTLAITNDVESPLSKAAEHVISLHTTKEQAVAATKTYTASLAALALLSCSLSEDEGRLHQLSRIPEAMRETFKLLESSIERTERYRYMEHCTVIGRGYNYATAFEIALKIKELTRVVAEPYSSADFRHGPIATAQKGFPVIVIVPRGSIYNDLVDLITTLRKRGVELLIISDDTQLLAEAHMPLPITSGLEEWLTPLIAVLPGQLLGMNLAVVKGLDADHPQGLSKVTETL